MNKIKILFLIHDLGVGGAEKVLVNLVNHLDRSRFDISVTALFGGGVNEQFLKPDIHYRAVFPRSIPGNSRIMKLFPAQMLHRFFIREHYDIKVAYLEGPSARIIAGGMWNSTRVPHVSTQHVAWIHVEQHTPRAASAAFRGIKEAEMLYNAFDRIVCVSETVKDDFTGIYQLKKEPVVLYNTVESNVILRKSREPVSDLSFQKNEFKIAVVGKLAKAKGTDRMVRITKRLRDEGYPVHLYLLGVGSEQKNLEKSVTGYGIDACVDFLGYQTNPYKYVSNCDLFVCASLHEGFSTAATEALIVGTPVVTTLVSGMKEMLGEHNEYGIIVPQDEEALYAAIKDLVEHPEKLAHYKKKAAERGKYFSTENTVRAVETMFLYLKKN